MLLVGDFCNGLKKTISRKRSGLTKKHCRSYQIPTTIIWRRFLAFVLLCTSNITFWDADDLKNLLLYLDLQSDVLNQQRSLLAPVEVQLHRLSPALEVTSMAQSHAFQFTSSSHNSILYPASLPYAYPVPSLCLLPRFVLPNFGFLFDILIKPNKFAPHSGGMSTLSPAFADLITHSIFNTSRWPDWIVNDANNYLYSNVSLGIHLEKPKWYFLHYFTLFYKKMQFGTNSSNISNNAV